MKEYEPEDKLITQYSAKIAAPNNQAAEELAASIRNRGYIHRNMAPLFGDDSYENQFPYKEAAKLYMLKTLRYPDDPEFERNHPNQQLVSKMAEESNYDFDVFEEKYTNTLNKKTAELMNDPYFQLHVRNYCINHSRGGFDADEFVLGYDRSLAMNKDATKEWSELIPASGQYSAKSSVQLLASFVIDEVEKGVHKGKDVSPSQNVTAAVDYIIAKTITGKAAEATFFKGIKKEETDVYNPKTGQNDIHQVKYFDNDMKKRVDQMRKQIMKDPLFRETICQEGMKLADVYDTYKAKVNQKINAKIKQNSALNKRLVKEKIYWKGLNEFSKKEKNPVSEDDMKEIRGLYDALKEYNKGKKPSDEMKALTEALDDMVKKPNATHLLNLNNAALKYYDKRQGIFFSPFTDNGKARLETVEKMIGITSPKADKIIKAYDISIKQPAMDQTSAVKSTEGAQFIETKALKIT